MQATKLINLQTKIVAMTLMCNPSFIFSNQDLHTLKFVMQSVLRRFIMKRRMKHIRFEEIMLPN